MEPTNQATIATPQVSSQTPTASVPTSEALESPEGSPRENRSSLESGASSTTADLNRRCRGARLSALLNNLSGSGPQPAPLGPVAHGPPSTSTFG